MKSGARTLKPTYGLPTESISIKETRIFINFDIQHSKLGRPFRLFGLKVNQSMPDRWINKVLKSHWIYEFKYLDEQGGCFDVEIDYYDNFYKLVKKP